MTEDERTDGKWKIEQCSVGPETAKRFPKPSGQAFDACSRLKGCAKLSAGHNL